MSKSNNFFSRLYKCYKKSGITGVLYQISENEYLPNNLFHFSKSNLYIYKGSNKRTFDYKEKIDKYDFCLASKDDIEALLDMSGKRNNHYESSKIRLSKFFDDGNSCYTVRDNKNIIAYVMLHRKSYTLTGDDYTFINLNISLSGNILFFGYGFISKKYRMRGLLPYMLNYAMTENDGSIFITEISELNFHSHNSHIRLGFKPIYSIIAFCALTKKTLSWKLIGGKPASISRKSDLCLCRDKSNDSIYIRNNSDTTPPY